ncbi:hypothetical protein scyTo_0024845, partial [Scyliorhinus torazame]|nr:hypothetical protein [Scyliorhinus torazame]
PTESSLSLSVHSFASACTSIARTICHHLTDTKPKLILYEHTDFNGLFVVLQEQELNLLAKSFDNAASSLAVYGCPWKACTTPGCASDGENELEIFEEGCYSNLGNFSDLISAVVPLKQVLDDPRISVFTDTSLQGRNLTVKREVNLKYSDINNMASSHIVNSGVWVLSSNEHNNGFKMLAVVGTEFDYSQYGHRNFNDRVSYICPLSQGKPKVVNVSLNCEASSFNSSVELLNELVVTNKSPLEQLLSVTHDLKTELSVEEWFRFGEYTVLQVGTSFHMSISMFYDNFLLSLGVEMRQELVQGLWVEKGVTERRTRTVGRLVQFNVAVPTNKTVKALIRLEERRFDVPTLLTIQHGCQLIQEAATFTCIDRTYINVEYEMLD